MNAGVFLKHKGSLKRAIRLALSNQNTNSALVADL